MLDALDVDLLVDWEAPAGWAPEEADAVADVVAEHRCPHGVRGPVLRYDPDGGEDRPRLLVDVEEPVSEVVRFERVVVEDAQRERAPLERAGRVGCRDLLAVGERDDDLREQAREVVLWREVAVGKLVGRGPSCGAAAT